MAEADPELAAIRARKLQELVKSSSARAAIVVTTGERSITLTDATFDAEVRKSGLLLVDFWAGWCGPCLRVGPVLEQIARDRAGSMRLGKLNVDENPKTAMRFQVMSIPTMLLFKDGKLVDGIVGALPRPQIEAVISKWA